MFMGLLVPASSQVLGLYELSSRQRKGHSQRGPGHCECLPTPC